MANGKYIALSDATFKEEVLDSDVPVLVDFWASWCGPCRKSFPFMQGLQQQHGDDLVVIAINLDKDRDDAHRFLDENLVTFLIGHDADGDVAKQFGVSVMPSSFIIDRDGMIQEIHMGFKSSTKKKITTKLGELLSLAAD